MIDRAAIIKQAKKAFQIADYSLILNHRILATAAKKLIEHGYRRAEFEKKYGRNFKFTATDGVKDSISYVNKEMERMVLDLLKEVEVISKRTGRDQVEKIPEEDWDKEAFLALVIHGFTFKQRTRRITTDFRNEIETYVRVGQEEGKTDKEVVQWYLDNIKEPKRDKLIDAAVSAGWAMIKGSSFKRFAILNNDTITRGYHRANSFYWRYASQKYIIAQIDDKTCERCTELDGQHFMIEEEVLPVHGSCRCIEVPVI